MRSDPVFWLPLVLGRLPHGPCASAQTPARMGALVLVLVAALSLPAGSSSLPSADGQVGAALHAAATRTDDRGAGAPSDDRDAGTRPNDGRAGAQPGDGNAVSPAGEGQPRTPPGYRHSQPLGEVRPGPAPGGAAGGYSPPWSWPLQPEPRVLRHFLPPPEPWRAGHRGVDLAAEVSRHVSSPAAGRVHFAGVVVDRPVITIDHGNGLLSTFEPVASPLKKGDDVAEGAALGSIAGPPHCPLPCVHWGVRRHGNYVNPLSFVSDRRPSILLPLNGPPGT